MVNGANDGLIVPEPEWSPFTMRQFNLSILKPPIVNQSGGTTHNNNSKVSMSSFTTPAKSLDILRQNVQRSLNSELKTVISKYLEVFFKPGIENIRNNSGPDSVTEEHIHTMCRQILEEAKKMYPVHPSTPSPLFSNVASGSEHNEPITADYHSVTPSIQQQTSTNNDAIKAPLTSPSFSGIKRESDTDSEASSLSNASKKLKKAKTGTDSKVGGNNTSNSNNHNDASTNSVNSPNKPKKPSGPSRKHVANWDAEKFTSETLFIMGAKANKALGFAQTRGRLYVKHPGLFKYASDSDDKEWLSKNKLMPATGGRAYIMLLEDIEKLARDNKLNAEINYDDIKGFRVPDFILDKMKSYITTWKKVYAEEAQRNVRNTNANRNQNNTMNISHNSTMMSPATTNSNSSSINLSTLQPQTLPQLLQAQPMQQQPQQQQQPQHLQQIPNQQQNMNSYHMNRNSPSNIIYEPSLLTLTSVSQPHELPSMGDYLHLDKNPPMYPGHSGQQHTLPQMTTNSTGYVHSTHIDPIEQALSKGDWSGVSDRSLLQYALQGSRNIGLWDPQDSFDLIESATNGNLSGGNMGDSSPLLQISPDSGAHLAAPPLLPVSPNCELGAVMDQAFQYTDT